MIIMMIDEEGDNQPEKNITPKECLEALEKVWAYCQLHDFQNSVQFILRAAFNRVTSRFWRLPSLNANIFVT